MIEEEKKLSEKKERGPAKGKRMENLARSAWFIYARVISRVYVAHT
jgi:hypothetical protein